MASVREHTQANDNEIKNILNKQSIELILHKRMWPTAQTHGIEACIVFFANRRK